MQSEQHQDGIVAYVGHEGTTINNVYNKGEIVFTSASSKTFVGGICGIHDNYKDTEDSYLKNSYNIGNINGEVSGELYVGNIYGKTTSTTLIENCYYLQNSQYEGIGQNNSDNSEVIGFTEDDKEELVSKLNKTINEWKYDTNNINNGYPILNWQQELSIGVTSKNTTREAGVVNDGETVSKDKLSNIYDLLGNSYEWTQEANYTDYRVFRESYYGNSGAPSNCSNNNPIYSNSNIGSRLTLYIKQD